MIVILDDVSYIYSDIVHRKQEDLIYFEKIYTKLQNSLLASCLSVHPHGTTRLQLGGISRSFLFEDFSKICQKIQISLKSDKNKRYSTGRPTKVLYSETDKRYCTGRPIKGTVQGDQ